MITLIAAADEVGCIGRAGRMPWHIPDDLRHFRDLTFGHVVAMGVKTWLSLPERPLRGRRNIVLSHTLQAGDRYEVVRSTADIIEIARTEDVYIIGGADLYRQMIWHADRIELTRVLTIVPHGDRFLPRIDNRQWSVTRRSEVWRDAYSGLQYQYQTLEKL